MSICLLHHIHIFEAIFHWRCGFKLTGIRQSRKKQMRINVLKCGSITQRRQTLAAARRPMLHVSCPCIAPQCPSRSSQSSRPCTLLHPTLHVRSTCTWSNLRKRMDQLNQFPQQHSFKRIWYVRLLARNKSFIDSATFFKRDACCKCASRPMVKEEGNDRQDVAKACALFEPGNARQTCRKMVRASLSLLFACKVDVVPAWVIFV